MSAATRLRRLDERADIVVFERGRHVSYANCGLPYFVGGVIEDRSELLLQSPEALREQFDLDVRVRHEAVGIDRDAQELIVRDLETSIETRERYDDLILSPGARPVIPPLDGVERALILRDVSDVDAMTAALESEPKTAVVIGAGFIGLELAENLLHRGLAVTLIEASSQVMPPLDPELAVLVEDELRAQGLAVERGTQVVRITDTEVVLSDGRTIVAELVALAIGVQPESTLAALAGLELGQRGAIVVNDSQQTSDPHIYAVGDAVEKRNALGGEPLLAPLANTANRQGRLVADVITGGTVTMRPTLGTAIVGLFGLSVALTGASEKRVRAQGIVPRIIHTHPFSHAGYYPGATQMAIKLLVDADTDEILGAQAVGGEGVDKRIDVIATAMAGGLRASDLADLELAYAPQFGSAKDPVNMLGFIAENLRDKTVQSMQWHELGDAVAGGSTLIDVRSGAEREEQLIPGSIHVPLEEIRGKLDELPAGDLIVHCAVGQRGHTAARILSQAGRNVTNLDGGLLTWQAGTRTTAIRMQNLNDPKKEKS